MHDYDAIVIGAGNGGLTAAATLAKNGVRVLVLERHNVPGGCATSFCRGRFEFEVALHQLSGLGRADSPGPLRMLLDDLGVASKLTFFEMRDLYRLVVPGKIDITLFANKDKAISALQEQFPKEKDSIIKFFDLVYTYAKELIGVAMFKDPEATRAKYPNYFKYTLADSQKVLDEYFTDPYLKLVLSAYWTYQGLPPAQLSFADLAMMIFAYIEFKPFHIKGGSQALSNAIAEKILSSGGEIRYNTAVTKILVKNGTVQGVVTDAGDTIHAPIVISNASKMATYINLIDREHVPDSVLSELKGAAIGPSAFTMYMGFDKEPKDLGIHESTHFIFPQDDIDNMYSQMRGLHPDKGGVMLTCYTVVDPSFSPPGTTQAALVTLQYGDQWFRIPPHQYASEKFRFAEKMLSMAETVFPGLRGNIEEMEIATPITHLRYLGHPKGAVYGFDELTRQSQMFVPNRPPIKGLFLAGCWVGSGGFQPTLENGGAAGRAALRQIRKGDSK